MILAECALEECGAGSVTHCGPLGYTGIHCFPCSRKVCNCELEVLEYPVHHIASVVTSLVDIRIGRSEDLVIVRDIAVCTDELEIEVCTEESSDSLIFLRYSSILALVEVLEHIVHLTKGGK